MGTTTLPDRIKQMIDDQLQRDERILWVEQPIAPGGFPTYTLPIVAFGLFWTAFSLYWMASATGVIGPSAKPIAQIDTFHMAFAAFGIPFVLVGLGMLSSPLLVSRRLRKAAAGTAYVITSRQAIVVDSGFAGNSALGGLVAWMSRRRGGVAIRCFGPSDISGLERLQREDGSGDITFGEAIVTANNSERTLTARQGFFSIRDPKKAETLLRNLARSAAQTNAGST